MCGEDDARCPKCGAKLNVISLQEMRVRLQEKETGRLEKRAFTANDGFERKISSGFLFSAKKASLSSRVIATLIDSVLMFVPSLAANFILPVFGGILLSAIYYITFTALKGQTPGKMVMGIKVVSTDGLPMTFEKAAMRHLGYILSYLTLGLGFLIAIWDKNNQCFHDKFAGTYVVEVDMSTSSLSTKQEGKGK